RRTHLLVFPPPPPAPPSPLFPYTTLFRSYPTTGTPPVRAARTAEIESSIHRSRCAIAALSLVSVSITGMRRCSQNAQRERWMEEDRKSTRLNSSHVAISYAVFCLKKKNNT